MNAMVEGPGCPSCGEPRGSERVCQVCGAYLPKAASTRPNTAAPTSHVGAAPVSEPDVDDPFGSREAFDALGAAGGIEKSLPRWPAAPPVEPQHEVSPGGEGAQESRVASDVDGHPSAASDWRLRLTDPLLEIPVNPGAGILLGRDPASPISSHPSVSGFISAQHARIWLDPSDPGVAYIADMSTNGTWLSGMRLAAGVRNVLRAGDVISLAKEHPVGIEVLG